MPRAKRLCIPCYPHHVVQRGNNRQIIFRDTEDRQTYLRLLRHACEHHNCQVHAWVLMGNHTHILITPQTDDGISKVMQHVGRCFVPYINEKYERTGTLFEGRFRSCVIDEEAYLFSCYRYIELNPVRAGIVKRAEHYKWSSYHANALGQFDPLVTPTRSYFNLGVEAENRRALYRRMFETSLAQSDIKKISATVNRFIPLGDGSFVDKLEDIVGIKLPRLGHGGDRRSNSFQDTA